MTLVNEGAGKRVGARRAAQRTTASLRTRLLLAGGTLLLVAAWGVLVKAAIDFGRTARGGDATAWVFLAIASLGAIACLFAGLLVGTRLLVALGVIRQVPAIAGGRRARR